MQKLAGLGKLFMHCISTIIMVMITRIIVPYNMNLLHVPKQWIKSTVYRNYCPVFLVIQSLARGSVQDISNVLFLLHWVLKENIWNRKKKSRQCAANIFVLKTWVELETDKHRKNRVASKLRIAQIASAKSLMFC